MSKVIALQLYSVAVAVIPWIHTYLNNDKTPRVELLQPHIFLLWPVHCSLKPRFHSICHHNRMIDFQFLIDFPYHGAIWYDRSFCISIGSRVEEIADKIHPEGNSGSQKVKNMFLVKTMKR